jgi:hypothetical protein
MDATNHAQIRLNANGQLVALSLGFHPGVRGQRRPAALQALLCKAGPTHAHVVEAVQAGFPPPKAPNLLEASRLTRNLLNVNYVEYGSFNPRAMLYFAPTFDMARFRGHLEFAENPMFGEDENAVASCCDEGFAIVVRGEPYIKALRGFHSALIDRKVVFADEFYTDTKFGGIVLADESLISEQDRMVIRTLQRLSEESLERELTAVLA